MGVTHYSIVGVVRAGTEVVGICGSEQTTNWVPAIAKMSVRIAGLAFGLVQGVDDGFGCLLELSCRGLVDPAARKESPLMMTILLLRT